MERLAALSRCASSVRQFSVCNARTCTFKPCGNLRWMLASSITLSLSAFASFHSTPDIGFNIFSLTIIVLHPYSCLNCCHQNSKVCLNWTCYESQSMLYDCNLHLQLSVELVAFAIRARPWLCVAPLLVYDSWLTTCNACEHKASHLFTQVVHKKWRKATTIMIQLRVSVQVSQ